MTISSDQLYLPRHDYVGRVMTDNNRPPAMLHNAQTSYNTGCLADAGYFSTLSVDQGVEYSVGASSAASPLYFDPKNIAELVIEAGCNCVASTYGVLISVSRRYAHHIPFLVKLNHNEALNYPNIYDQTLYASVEQVFNMGVMAVGAAIYFGSEEPRCQIEETPAVSERAYELGVVTVLWAYLRNSVFKKDDIGYHISAGLTGQAGHLTAVIGVDIVKQKMAESDGGYKMINYGYTNDRVYNRLISENPIDLARYQPANYYMDRAGLISFGGAAGGKTDLSDAVHTAIINKRVDEMGLTLGRRTFKKLMANGVKPINAVQDVYLDSKITTA